MRTVCVTAFVLCVVVGFQVSQVVVAAQEPVSCGPNDEKEKIIKHKEASPVPAPTPGKAVMVVILGKAFGKSYQQKLAVNGQWRAVLNESQYTFFEVDPGVLKLCWGGRGAGKRDYNYLLLTAQVGQTYYIRGKRQGISEVESTEGRRLLGKMAYVTFEVRNEH